MVRQQLSINLAQPASFTTHHRNENDKQIVMQSFPRARLPAVILHKRYLIDKDLVDPDNHENYGIECTFLLVGGEEDPRYTLQLFKVGDVATYLVRNQANVVISLLR